MTSENVEIPTAPSSRDEQPRPREPLRRIPTVEECGLKLSKLRLVSLICVSGARMEPLPAVASIDCEGKLVEETLGPDGFQAVIEWSVSFAEPKAPISITGKHELTFTVTSKIEQEAADYYSRTNGLILAYPYIRQIIDDLSVKSLGQGILVPLLDVPGWVKKVRQERAEETARREEEARRAESRIETNAGGEPHARNTGG